MPRYFLEVGYKGTRYRGFQVQDNVLTIQGEVEKALQVYFRCFFQLSVSSRTDAGVHALQNYFHFDSENHLVIENKQLYNLNALLPADIVVKRIVPVAEGAHARFHALSRQYRYYLYQSKNPFLDDRGYYYPYALDLDLLNAAAELVKSYRDFTSFSKRNTKVKTFLCTLADARWYKEGEYIVFQVEANRFLRGMVRGLVGSMLRVGRGYITLDHWKQIIEAKDCSKADFSAPPQGLFLVQVSYSQEVFLPEAAAF